MSHNQGCLANGSGADGSHGGTPREADPPEDVIFFTQSRVLGPWLGGPAAATAEPQGRQIRQKTSRVAVRARLVPWLRSKSNDARCLPEGMRAQS